MPHTANDPAKSRLEQISTIHQLPRGEVALRYGKAIRCYLLALLGDEEHANDVAWKMQHKILAGELEQWDPALGRFRDYLKVSVRNAAKDYRKALARRGKELTNEDLALIPDPDGTGRVSSDEVWLRLWRETLVERALRQLRRYQDDTPDNVAFEVVQLLMREPQLASEELAARLSAQAGRPILAATARKHKERALAKFAQLLVEEVMATVAEPSAANVENELRSAGLFTYVAERFPEAFAAAREKLPVPS